MFHAFRLGPIEFPKGTSSSTRPWATLVRCSRCSPADEEGLRDLVAAAGGEPVQCESGLATAARSLGLRSGPPASGSAPVPGVARDGPRARAEGEHHRRARAGGARRRLRALLEGPDLGAVRFQSRGLGRRRGPRPLGRPRGLGPGRRRRAVRRGPLSRGRLGRPHDEAGGRGSPRRGPGDPLDLGHPPGRTPVRRPGHGGRPRGPGLPDPARRRRRTR